MKKFLRKVKDSLAIQLILFIVGAALVCVLLFYLFAPMSFRRSIVDFKSEWTGGLNRTIRVYTVNGDLIAEYQGKIDLDANDGGYVKFDFEGKRYIYYNCFIESIADIN